MDFSKEKLSHFFEYSGTTVVIISTVLITSNIGYMPYIFLSYFIGNALFAGLGLLLKRWGLFGMNVFLCFINVWGILRWTGTL